MRILLYAAIALLVVIIALLSAAALTGRTKRAYAVLSPDDVVVVAGESVTASRLAETYQPKMYLRRSTPSPELLRVWYEAVPAGATIDLVYYHVWENEISPDPIIHMLYTGFRAAYYGYPLYDIEYFQVSVSRETGLVTGLVFETSLDDDFYQSIPIHTTARYALKNDGSYSKALTGRDSDLVHEHARAPVAFEERRVLAAVQTWNHLSRLVDGRESEHDLQEAELDFLTDRDFRRYKFVRKSQGDHRTEESALTAPVAALAVSLFVALPARLISKKWNR